MNQNLSIKEPKSEDDQKIILEQYKILIEALNKLNETRENSNNLWMGVNAAGISMLAYLRDSQNIPQYNKPFLLLTIITLGLFFSLSWLNYLWTIKKSFETRVNLLIELEKNFPVPLFSTIYSISQKKSVRAVLTSKEMIIPFLFLVGYFFFIFLLLFFPQEVVSSSHPS